MRSFLCSGRRRQFYNNEGLQLECCNPRHRIRCNGSRVALSSTFTHDMSGSWYPPVPDDAAPENLPMALRQCRDGDVRWSRGNRRSGETELTGGYRVWSSNRPSFQAPYDDASEEHSNRRSKALPSDSPPEVSVADGFVQPLSARELYLS